MNILLPKSGKCVKVSPEDYEYLAKFRWHVSNGYAARAVSNGRKNLKHFYMHREIMKPADGMEVDHVNGDRLDNRRENLRIVSHKINIRNTRLSKNNTSGVNGVSWSKKRGKWLAQITVDYKNINLGAYSSLAEAAEARRNGEIKYYG